MGVTQLWQILAPVQQHRPLSSLAGLTLAVDLSIWVCETQCVKQMQGVVSKPFLRNLFFRISHLTQLGVKLVFVVEGTAPKLKWEAMMKRQQVRFPGRQGRQTQHRQGRRNFNSCLRECCELLDILGIPYVQSQGEAEAMCAVLNAAGLVDGCLTNDGDAFLYGTTVVYRNFTMNTKDPHVESYRMSDIQTELGIDREGLVALALLLGCDYIPKGVPGVGPANAVKLLQTLRGRNVLKRLREWKTISESECLDQVEVLMRRKAIAVTDFPQEKVIKEFLVSRDKCPRVLPSWKRPIINRLQDFALDKLEWPVEYGLEKILPLVTLWDMRDITQSKHGSRSLHLKPHRLVKSRVRQGVPCYEVEWHKPVSDTTCPDDYYTTIEEQELFSQCYPQIVDDFKAAQEEKKAKKSNKGTRKKKKEEEQKEETNEDTEPIQAAILTQSSACQIPDELSDSFASLKVDDSKTDTENMRTGMAGTDSQKIGVLKKCKGKKSENDKTAKSRTLFDAEGDAEKLCCPESLDNEANDNNIKVRNSTNGYGKTDLFVRENHAEILDISDDSFIPLSMRVKKKLQERMAVDKFDMFLSEACQTYGQNSIPVLEEICDGLISESKTELESINRFKTVNHPSFSDSYALPTDLDKKVDTVSQFSDVSEARDKAHDNSVVRNDKNFEDMVTVRHIGCTPRSSMNESHSNTPLSLQKQFVNNRFNTKVSSPLAEGFSSPVTYIKQNSKDNDETHSFIEIIDTPDCRKLEIVDIPDFRKPEILVTDNIDRNISAEKRNIEINDFSPCKLNTDKSEISKMDDNLLKNLRLDGKRSIDDKQLDVMNGLVITPLYSVNRCVQNISQTIASPLHLLCNNKLNISEMSMLDKPDFNVQTSLLNSLYKTLNITSSPFSFSYDQNVVTEDNADGSFHGSANQAMNSESDSSQTGLENVGDSQKKIYDNDGPSRNETGVHTANFAQGMGSETNLTGEQVEVISENEETRTTITKVFDHNIAIGHTYSKESVIDSEGSKDGFGLEHECTDINASQTSKIAVVKENNDKGVMLNDSFHKTGKTDTDANSEHSDETKAVGKPILKDVTGIENSQNNTENDTEAVSASQKTKRGKAKGRKGKKKGDRVVKKVSAFMDLSHDSDDSFILSQMISSQKQSAPLDNRNLWPKSCNDHCPLDHTDKENIDTMNQSTKETKSPEKLCGPNKNDNEVEKEYTAELITGYTNIGSAEPDCSFLKTYVSSEINSSADSVNDVDLLIEPLNVNVNLNECIIDHVTERTIEHFDVNNERIDLMPKENKFSVFDKAKPLKAKSIPTLDMTVAAASPVSLADRLKKRLKNSSTRQVLTDFTK